MIDCRIGRRSRQPQGRLDRDKRRHPYGISSEKRDLDDPDRLRLRQRTGRVRPRRQSGPAGRQPHGLQQHRRRACTEAARAAFRAGSPGQGDRLPVNPDNPTIEPLIRDTQAAARTQGVQLQILKASSEREIDAAFATLVPLRAGGELVVDADALFTSHRKQVAALASRDAVPAIYPRREFPIPAGWPATDLTTQLPFVRLACTPARSSRVPEPADLPVQQPTTSNWSSISRLLRHSASRPALDARPRRRGDRVRQADSRFGSNLPIPGRGGRSGIGASCSLPFAPARVP